MKSTKDGRCDSVFDVREQHDGFALCRRELGHAGMHSGPAPDSEMFQWTTANEWKHVELTPEQLQQDDSWWLPPLDSEVVIQFIDGETSKSYRLRATVMNADGCIHALLIDELDGTRRGLVSWRDVSSITWERESND